MPPPTHSTRRPVTSQPNFTKIGAGALLLAVIALVLTRCSPTVTDDVVVRQVLAANWTEGNHSPLYPVNPATNSPLPWQFHFDLSSTMNGFLNPPDEKFRALGQKLLSTADTNASFVGEAGTNSGVPLAWAQLASPGTYVERGLDYQALFVRLLAEANVNHALITDGIPLRGRELDTPPTIIAGHSQFLNQGGDVTLLAIRMPYSGLLTSVKKLREATRNVDLEDVQVSVNTTGRPLLLWLFIQPGQSISSASHPLGRLGERLELRASTNGLADWDSAFGSWTCLIPPSRAHPPMTLLNEGEPSIACREKLPGMIPVKWLTIGNSLSKARILTNLVSIPWRGEEEATGPLASNLTVTLSAWTHSRSVSNPIVQATLEAPSFEWKALPEAKPVNYGFGPMVSARLILTPARPEPARAELETDKFVWLLTVGYAATALPPRLAAFSTDDDSQPASADAIYGLGELLKMVQGEMRVHSRTIFFADWSR